MSYKGMTDKEYYKQWHLKNREKQLPILKENSRKWYRKNKKHAIAHKVKYHRANPHIVKNAKLKMRYGITLVDYDRMLLEQKGVCKICRRAEDKRTKILGVDHCHKTKKVRGLLCWKCNAALGQVNDNPEILKEMIKYLEK